MELTEEEIELIRSRLEVLKIEHRDGFDYVQDLHLAQPGCTFVTPC